MYTIVLYSTLLTILVVVYFAHPNPIPFFALPHPFPSHPNPNSQSQSQPHPPPSHSPQSQPIPTLRPHHSPLKPLSSPPLSPISSSPPPPPPPPHLPPPPLVPSSLTLAPDRWLLAGLGYWATITLTLLRSYSTLLPYYLTTLTTNYSTLSTFFYEVPSLPPSPPSILSDRPPTLCYDSWFFASPQRILLGCLLHLHFLSRLPTIVILFFFCPRPHGKKISPSCRVLTLPLRPLHDHFSPSVTVLVVLVVRLVKQK